MGKTAFTVPIRDKQKLVDQVIGSGHLSIAEHITISLSIEGIDRATANQLVRHRLCTFSQQSMRYCDMKDVEFLIPDDKLTAVQEFRVRALLMHTKELYNQLVEEGVKKEDARAILPLCTATNLVMTTNLRNLIHIAELRMCTRAQKPIRELFTAIADRLYEYDPWLGRLLKPQCERLGFCPEHNGCGRKEPRKDDTGRR